MLETYPDAGYALSGFKNLILETFAINSSPSLKDIINYASLGYILKAMDKELMFCKSLSEIQDIVSKFVTDVSKGSLSLDAIPIFLEAFY